MSKIIDCFSFCGEYDTLEIRFNVLNEFVDEFVIVEAPTTFSGRFKPLYWAERDDRFYEWEDKVKYHVIDENYTPEEIALAESSPNTVGADHWKHEFAQKESIKKALTHLKDDDLVIVGDVDEIWKPSALEQVMMKIKLDVYAYYLNNRSTEEFWGSIVFPYGIIKESILNHLRSETPKTEESHGWHFTSIGGLEKVKRKLEDSYTEETYASPWIMKNLEYNLITNKDFLGRDFTYTIDESEWPQYLKNNKERYKKLCKHLPQYRLLVEYN